MPAENASLYTALEHAIGSEPTVTLMEQLPDRGRVATRDDLNSFEQSLRSDFSAKFGQTHLAMHGMYRTFVITQVTSTFGAVGLFFGINQLI